MANKERDLTEHFQPRWVIARMSAEEAAECGPYTFSDSELIAVRVLCETAIKNVDGPDIDQRLANVAKAAERAIDRLKMLLNVELAETEKNEQA